MWVSTDCGMDMTMSRAGIHHFANDASAFLACHGEGSVPTAVGPHVEEAIPALIGHALAAYNGGSSRFRLTAVP